MSLCTGCGGELPHQERPRNPRRWCSEACRLRTFRERNPEYVARQAQLQAARHRETYKPTRHDCTCVVCSESFTARTSRALYCSTKCRDKAYSDRRKADGRKAKYDAESKERRREYRREYRARRGGWRSNYPELAVQVDETRKVRKAIDAEVVAPVEVYERDGWTCQICRKPIDASLAWPDPASASLDHVIPLVAGGRHQRDNLQAAHLLCNQQKGANLT